LSEKMNPENEFYEDMDRKTARQSCCTFPTLIALFVLMALIVGSLTFFLASKIKTLSLPSPTALENFSSKFQLNPQSSPTFSIPITADDLNSMAGGLLSVGGLQVQKWQFSINELGIETTGELVKFKLIKFHLKMFLIPEIADKKLKFKIQKVMVSRLNLPGYFRVEIEKSLNHWLDENFQELYQNYQVENIALKKNEMIISGRLK